MMAFPQARVTDLHMCVLLAPPPAPLSPVPAPMPILPPCCPTVFVGGLPAARAFVDLCTPACPHPIVKGSSSVLITNFPAARISDSVSCGGVIVKGQPNVLVGG